MRFVSLDFSQHCLLHYLFSWALMALAGDTFFLSILKSLQCNLVLYRFV